MLSKLLHFLDKMTYRKKAKNIMKIECTFCDVLVKNVNTKGELLFNHKNVDGAPRTKNVHKRLCKQLKYLL